MTVGSRLKEWRLENKLKTTDIYKKTGISTGGFSDYENDIKLIGSKTLITLWNHYKIHIQYILTGERNAEILNDNQEVILKEYEKELLDYFRELPKDQKQRELGRLEGKAEQYKDQQEKSSTCRTG